MAGAAMNELGPFVRPTALPFWDVAWSGARSYAIGTAYASMTDSAAAIRTAIAEAATLGVPVVGTGRFRVDSTVTLASDADFTGAEFVCSDTAISPVVRIGSAVNGTVVNRIRVVAPKVIQAAKTTTGWTGASVGIEIANLYASHIAIPLVRYFTTGLLLTSYVEGTVYNKIDLGHLENNKVNLKLLPADTGAWVNENIIISGRCQHESAEGTGVSGTRHVLVTYPTGGNPANNNRFIAVSLEGNVNEYNVECIGQHNIWDWCRWESTTPKVYFNQVSATEFANSNMIRGGYDSYKIVFTESTNSKGKYNSVQHRNGWHLVGNSSSGVMVLENATSGASPSLLIMPPGSGPSADKTTDWLGSLAGTIWQTKQVADTQPRWKMAATTGKQEWGPGGSTAPDTGLERLGPSLLGTSSGDKFVANAGLGVGNSAAGSTPGTCVKKMEVFDAAGTSLGFLAIYNAIS